MFTKKPQAEYLPAFYTLCAEACERAGEPTPEQEGFVRQYAALLQEKDAFLRLVFDGQQLAGFCQGLFYAPLPDAHKVCMITSVYVAPAFRRRGAGSGLLMAAFAVARGAGAEEIQIPVSRVASGAQDFLEKNGFARTAHCYGKGVS